MLEFVGAADQSSSFSVTARPNSVVGRPGLLVAMGLLVPACTVVGIAFLFLGAWPVTLFMGLHIFALLMAFRYVERHSGDFERLTLDDQRLILDRHTPDGDQHFEFNGFWVQVDLRRSAVGAGNSLCLRSHGKEVCCGCLMSEEERCGVSRELCRRLAQLRH